jgi:hypothetical protein
MDMGPSVEKIEHHGKVLAVIARARSLENLKENKEKMSFISPNDFPLQLGLHNRQKGETIAAHFHIPFTELKNFPVQEFFYIVAGKVKIDLYDDRNGDRKVNEVIISSGDTILLNTGHGLTILEDTQMIELKQGPYRGREMEKRTLRGTL